MDQRRDLVRSDVARQNVLNNKFAIEELRKNIGIHGVSFEGDYWVTRKQVADFYGVSERAISDCTLKNEKELRENGYDVLRGNRLKTFVLAIENQSVNEDNFILKTRNLAIYSFRGFLNVGMLLSRSDVARQVRAFILDVVIDTIKARSGGMTKYINQRDEDYVISLLTNADYHKEYVEALGRYIDLGRVKYVLYTNKIYKSIFKEDADEYRQILRLSATENERETMYAEVLDLIASYEKGYASELRRESERLGRPLTNAEADGLFARFESMELWIPIREKARMKMASRDLCFRDVLHDKLVNYVQSVPMEDFERFMGDDSMPIEERLTKFLLSRTNELPDK